MNEAQISRQHPIPQNFMDVEFKIVGEFTVRQFTYLCATGFPMYLIFSSPIQSFIKTVLLIILGILGFLLVFVPIDDRSMDVWIVNFFKSVYSHNRRVWRKTPFIPKTLSMETIRLVQGEMITLAPTSSRRKLEEYLKGIKEEAPDEFDFDFKKHQFNEVYVPTKVSIATETEVIPEKPMIIPEVVPQKITPEIQPAKIQETLSTPPVAPTPKPAIEEVVIKLPQTAKPVIAETRPTTPPTELFKKITQPIKVVPTALKEILKPKPKLETKIDVHEELRTSSAEMPGRKFVSFGEREQEIILPIRGERTIPILQQPLPDTGQDIKKLTKELRTLVREIRNEESPTQTKPQATVTPEVTVENNLSGICFDQNNNPLPNLMLVLLNDQDQELQYTITDNLGKFTFKYTILGTFKIKVLNPEIYALNFDIMSFSISKYPYTFIQLVGKK